MQASMARAIWWPTASDRLDTDAGQAGFQAGTTHGAYGDLALNADGTWTYTAANGSRRFKRWAMAMR